MVWLCVLILMIIALFLTLQHTCCKHTDVFMSNKLILYITGPVLDNKMTLYKVKDMLGLN